MRVRVLAVALVPAVLGTACSRSTSSAGGGGGVAARAAAPAMPSGVTPQMIAMGDSIFNNIGCRNCHGMGGVGGTNGPSLKEGAWLHGGGTYPELVRIITTGIAREAIKNPARTRAMNPRGGPANLTDAQVAAVAAYVWQISRPKG